VLKSKLYANEDFRQLEEELAKSFDTQEGTNDHWHDGVNTSEKDVHVLWSLKTPSAIKTAECGITLYTIFGTK